MMAIKDYICVLWLIYFPNLDLLKWTYSVFNQLMECKKSKNYLTVYSINSYKFGYFIAKLSSAILFFSWFILESIQTLALDSDYEASSVQLFSSDSVSFLTPEHVSMVHFNNITL